MAGLISRDAVCDEIGKMIHEYREKDDHELADALILARRYVLKRLPAVYAVPVVRCRDCKFYYGVNEECGCNGGYHSEDWYCADGERRDGEA